MVRTIDRDSLRVMLERGTARVVEVLPESEYEREHLPGAERFPLTAITAESVRERLDGRAPVVTYCWDRQCDLSARAAALLESFGIEDVYRYPDGKVGWKAAGLPTEGKEAEVGRAGHVARDDVPLVRHDESPDDARRRLEGSGWEHGVVVDEGAVVLGRVDRSALAAAGRVIDAVDADVRTIRPDTPLTDAAQTLRDGDLDEVVVTTSDGVFVGLIRADEPGNGLPGQ